jgi:hypothetical protein
VQTELANNKLGVTKLDPLNLSISSQGKAGDFETALHATIEMHTWVYQPRLLTQPGAA